MRKYLLFIVCSLCLSVTCAQTAMQSNGQDKNVTVITTADSTKFRLSETATLKLSQRGQPVESEPCIFIDSTRQFQTFVGIGGALTDAAAETFFKLSQKQQDTFLEAYFDKQKGIGYSLARTNMNSCDFSSDMYTCTTENDKDLKSFNVNHDLKFKIPFIKKAFKAAGSKIKLFISPWSPPAWMKDNKNMLHGGKLLPEYYRSWADYYIKFIKTYEMNGIPVWGLSVQNEPMATQTWESCIYTAEEERDFVKNYLGPALWKNNLSDKKLIAWDHNRDLIYHRASVLLSDKESSKY
ncbi:MAG: glycosyl hydrolase, partial [Bacteroidota bacterium]